ncbi:hypothetical protein HHI36_021498 [Cryptolaemus montrouzieri]
MMGFSGIFLPQLKNDNSFIKDANGEIDSWIASSAVLPMTFMPFFGGYFMDKIGRKWSHFIAAIPAISGWIIIAISQNLVSIIIGRVLTGIYCGLLGPITSVYIGEATSPSIRPFLLGGIAMNLTLGTLLCHLMGTFFSWQTTAWFCLLFPFIGAIFTFFSTESPRWYIDKNRIEEACVVFKKIRGESEESNKELDVMMENYKNQTECTRQSSLWNTVHELITKPELYKPLIILVLYFMSAQFVGINVVTFYAIDIVEGSLGKNFVNQYLVMLAMDSVRVVSSVLACVLLRKLRRRQLAIIGGSGCCICLITLSISNYLLSIIPDSKVLLVAPLVALLAYMFFISICVVPLPWCLAGELLPQKVKGLASSLLCFSSFSAFFLAIKFSPFLFTNIGSHFTYLLFASSALFGTVLCSIFLPETKNKTLDEISNAFKKDRCLNK